MAGLVAAMREVAQPALRPCPPPLLAIALPFWGAAALLYPVLRQASLEVCAFAAFAALLVGSTLLRLVWKGKGKRLLLCVLGVALGIFCSCAHAVVLHAQMDQVRISHYAEWEFTALEDASEGTFGASVVARGSSEALDDLAVRVNLPDGFDLPLRGERFSGAGIVRAPSDSAAAYCWENGIAASMSLSSAQTLASEGADAPLVVLRRAAIEGLGEAGDEDGLIAALACGYRPPLDETVYADFKVAGLAHIVAVSGAHLTLAVSFVALLLRFFRAPRAAVAGASLIFIAGYLLFSGVPVSGIRAAFMATASLFSFAAKRRAAALNALALCVIGFAAVSPADAASASFVLSAGSTLGIIVFSRLIGSWIDALPIRVPRLVRDGAALTLSANLATTAYSAALFSQIPLISPLSNVVAGALFPFACGAGIVSALACAVDVLCGQAFSGWPNGTFSSVAVAMASWPCDALAQAASLFVRVPLACVPASLGVAPSVAITVALCAGLWWFWPKPGKRACGAAAAGAAIALACVLALSLVRPANEVVMMDVGQGDAFLVRSRGSALLVDTGNRDADLLAGLARQGIRRLDALLVTHADDDHCGSLDALRGVVEVESILVAEGALSCACDNCAGLREDAARLEPNAVEGLRVGDTVRLGDAVLEVVWPDEFQDEGGNADSLTFVCRFDADRDGVPDWSALFCGDAEAEQIEDMIAQGRLGRVDVLKVGHHGSKAALSAEALEALSPSIALVSAGANNRFGHPSPEVLQLLDDAGARVFRTDEQGDVSCELGEKAIAVRTMR